MSVTSSRSAPWNAFVLATAASLAVPVAAEAANYYLQATMTGTFNSTNLWWSDPVEGGDHPTTMVGNDFYSNGYRVRTGNASYTFGNATTTLHLDAQLLVRTSGTAAITIPNLLTSGTSANIGAGAGGANLNLTNFVNDGDTYLNGDDSGSRALNVAIDTLSGTGHLELRQSITLNLTINTATDFTGEITWLAGSGATLNFNNPLISSGGLVASSSSRILLDEQVSFASVTLGETDLSPGVYDYNYLKTTFGDIFVDVDELSQGSITVVPEPAGLALLGSGALLMLRRRRD